MSWQADRVVDSNRWDTIRELVSAGSPLDLRVAVLAAHPDDETIGAAAWLMRSAHPTVIYLTDGAPRDGRLWPPDFHDSREEYAALRRREAHAALAHFGLSEPAVRWLGGIDQEAIFEIPALSKRLLDSLTSDLPDFLITHSYEGGHPDHDAASLAAQLAVCQLRPEVNVGLMEMTSYHTRKGQCVTGEFLNSDARSELTFELSETERERKRQAFDAYASQRLVLSSFSVGRERLRHAPEYDFTKPPHEGELWYEHMGWMTGERWRELASSAMTKMQEHACP